MNWPAAICTKQLYVASPDCTPCAGTAWWEVHRGPQAASAMACARGLRGLGGADHVYPFTTRHATCWADRCWLCWCPWAMKPGCPGSWHLYLDLSGFLNWYNMKNVTLCYCMCVSYGHPLSTMPWPCLPCFLQLMDFAVVMGHCFPQFFWFILQFKCFWTGLQLDSFFSSIVSTYAFKNFELRLNKAQLLKPM